MDQIKNFVKEASKIEKLKYIDFCFSEICNPIRKYLKKDFFKAYPYLVSVIFPKRYIQKLSGAEVAAGYRAGLDGEHAEIIAEHIFDLWMQLANPIYYVFADYLSKITHDFESIESIPEETETALLQEAIQKFGATNTLIFSIFNGVVFSDRAFEQLIEESKKSLSISK